LFVYTYQGSNETQINIGEVQNRTLIKIESFNNKIYKLHEKDT